MPIGKSDLLRIGKLIQKDLHKVLDGLDESTIKCACDVVHDRLIMLADIMDAREAFNQGDYINTEKYLKEIREKIDNGG